MRKRIFYKGRMRFVEFLDEPDVPDGTQDGTPDGTQEVTPDPETEKPKRKRRKKED